MKGNSPLYVAYDILMSFARLAAQSPSKSLVASAMSGCSWLVVQSRAFRHYDVGLRGDFTMIRQLVRPLIMLVGSLAAWNYVHAVARSNHTFVVTKSVAATLTDPPFNVSTQSPSTNQQFNHYHYRRLSHV